MRYRLVMAAFIAVMLLGWLYAIARAQEGYRGQGHQQYHGDFYQGLTSPAGTSCCNNADCRPTKGRTTDTGIEVMVEGKWVKVLPNKVLKVASPTGGYHVCAPWGFDGQPESIYCVIVPLEARHGASFKQARI